MIQIIDLQYFGNFNYYKILLSGLYVTFNLSKLYEKRLFMNRCVIPGPNGVINLSVPLLGGRNQKSAYREIRICNEDKWQKRHWKTFQSSYNSSPWFKFYSDSLSSLYLKKSNFLVDWNLACLEWSFDCLNVELNYGLFDCKQENGNCPDSDAGEKSSSSEKSTAAILETRRYNQVFEDKTGFLPGMSILDLLFCEGSREVLSRLR